MKFVSEQAVLDLIKSEYGMFSHPEVISKFIDLEKKINDMPSVDPFINKPCISQGVCREDKAKVLDKIRAEIESKLDSIPYRYNEYDDGTIDGLDYVLQIIDKYRLESEGHNVSSSM